jgi:hypothetical protein
MFMYIMFSFQNESCDSVAPPSDRDGNGISFQKFRGIDSEWFPLFRGRKWSFPGIPRFTKEPIPKVGTEGNDMKKIGFAKNPAPANRIDSMFLSKTCYRM